ncbi:MAG: hypothetical protein H7288_11550 [Kineosporiaceae bacterium]|nr:hypothetical protein [Aeromicrobium sp.]
MSSENLIRLEDARAGRVIETWRYGLASWLPVFAVVAARLLPSGFWMNSLIIIVAMVAFNALLGRYKRRSLH